MIHHTLSKPTIVNGNPFGHEGIISKSHQEDNIFIGDYAMLN